VGNDYTNMKKQNKKRTINKKSKNKKNAKRLGPKSGILKKSWKKANQGRMEV